MLLTFKVDSTEILGVKLHPCTELSISLDIEYSDIQCWKRFTTPPYNQDVVSMLLRKAYCLLEQGEQEHIETERRRSIVQSYLSP